ncbi:MFS transporter [Streptomyces sp. HNM0574]|uniref:MFS transporter n=1 Tax=Streptomyces sp. HNM0574 TaxID=2714954 RepID=UPI00146A7A1E|nr:MFS transporter [Streptomyces sp. HNM0574]NLU69338.1 MFS transporter [Streptomyces sp. HNM0574]
MATPRTAHEAGTPEPGPGPAAGPDGPAAAPASNGRRELLAGTVGGVVESFDWTIYAVLAPYFAAQMFPGDDPVTKVLGAYLGFAVGFVVRPFGSYVMGRISDSRGRRFGLMLSMGLISGASFLIAALPTAQSIGMLAPALLVVLRLVQGLSMGGENPSVAAYITETAPKRLRFLYSGISYGGIILGNILCFGVLTLLLTVLGEDGVADGGWRAGFVVAGLLGLASLWVRRAADESEEFTRSSERAETETPAAARAERRRLYAGSARNMTAVFLMTLGVTVSYYLGTTYLPQYAENLGLTSGAAGTGGMIAPLLLLIAAMAGAGIVADRTGPAGAFRAGTALLALLTVPVFSLMGSGVLPVWAATVLQLLCLAAPLALANVLFARLFPVRIRVVAMGLPFTLATGLFGGTFPLLAEALTANGRIGLVPWCAALAAAVSFGASFLAREPVRETAAS